MARQNRHATPTVAPREVAREEGRDHRAHEADSPAKLFEKILEGNKPRLAWPAGEPFIAECIEAHHPTLRGRVKIRWDGGGKDPTEWWVPTLQGLAIRKADRLLLQTPHGEGEPIVVGVIDGFLPRPEPERSVAARIEVKQDEVLQVCSQEGQPLVEIVRDSKGPVVRLLQADTRVDIQGKLSITAAELELKAVKGEVRIQASDDVNVVGEAIHLN
jgi:hypothetical protein